MRLGQFAMQSKLTINSALSRRSSSMALIGTV